MVPLSGGDQEGSVHQLGHFPSSQAPWPGQQPEARAAVACSCPRAGAQHWAWCELEGVLARALRLQLPLTHLEGQSQDAPRRRHVARQPLGLGAHEPQHLCFGAVGHGPLQKCLQGLPARQRATVTTRAHGARAAMVGALERQLLLQSPAPSMIDQVLQRGESGGTVRPHKGPHIHGRRATKRRIVRIAESGGGLLRRPVYSHVSRMGQ